MIAIRWSTEASADLQAAHDFIARDSEHYAALLVARILRAIDQLEEFPTRGPSRPRVGR